MHEKRWRLDGVSFFGLCINAVGLPAKPGLVSQPFLGSGEHQSNSWPPTSAQLRVENRPYPALKGMPSLFSSSLNDWYRWKGDLRKKDIDVRLSIDPSGFPLDTGPKPHEIWRGDFPVVWTNQRYRMIYFNMSHNVMDYENKTNRQLSHTFGNPVQDKLVLNALLWLGKNGR
jgi:uncharacterized protein